MQSTTRPTNSRRRPAPGVAAALRITGVLVAAICGCGVTHNQFRETGPATTESWDSPTAADVKAHYSPAPTVRSERDWPRNTVAAESGTVTHGALYFEDPFVDKGDGRTDETDPNNVYRWGWEDYVAFPYCLSRYTLNWLALPVSMVVTPPWVPLESDGVLSKQALGYDHDATRADQQRTPQTPPAAQAESANTPPPAADTPK